MPVARVVHKVERHGDVERLHMARAVVGKPVYWVSAYRTGDVLVDSGCAACRVALQRFVSQRPVTAALTTHEHEDHVGNHAILEGVETFAPRRAVQLLEDGPPRLPFYRWIAWGGHDKARHVKPLDGTTVTTTSGRRFRVVHTPGHSAEHVVYVDEDASAVFTGDAYFGKLRAVRAKENVPLQLESLRRIAEMDLAVLYPAHGPIVERPREKLLDTVQHFDELAAKARRLREKGRTTRQIRSDLLGPEPFLTYFSQGAFSAENLVKSLLEPRKDI